MAEVEAEHLDCRTMLETKSGVQCVLVRYR